MWVLCIYSYHSQKALQMMNKYRIGRVSGPWVNFTPPIRGGTYRDNKEAAPYTLDDDDDEDAGSCWESSTETENSNSSATSLDSISTGDTGHSPTFQSQLNKGLYQYSPITHRGQGRNTQPEEEQHLSPEDYTTSAVQRAIDNDCRDNPSLDAKTQGAITLKYQMLHQRVKDEGFYDCHYVEYGKEIVRYALLFSLFFAFLRAEWYLTSACFLGLFWVSHNPI